MKIGLGTVQFGMSYGISNTGGQVPQAEVASILMLAAARGIQVLDTAALYGNSEAALGHVLAPDNEFKIVTKTPRFGKKSIDESDVSSLVGSFQRSLRHLRKTTIYGLLIHQADDLLAPGGAALFRAMEGLKDQGLVKKIGVSVYTGEQIDEVMESFAVDLVQLPVSVLDQRLVQSGHLARLKEYGVEVHARSVFLQGLLLMEPESLPPYFISVKKHLQDYREMLKQDGTTPLQAALAFVCNLDEVAVTLCGVESKEQLSQLMEPPEHSIGKEEYSQFALNDADILNPANWKL
ncbi:2,5-diketo-D-gluconate reductase B [mine drainage metagenome]|uniref:2,5-diketo-D-gluconate reductase B n=1 Tax=mine drainage metagenome TaxID=410659 RepID=A0A1J5QYK5_9ZZZZ